MTPRAADTTEDRKPRSQAKKRTSGRTAAPARGVPARGKPSLEPQFRLYLEMGGRIVHVSMDVPREEAEPTCGQTIVAQAPDIARELNALCIRNPALYKAAQQMLGAGGAGGLAMALWPVALKLAQNHVLPSVAERRAALYDEGQFADETAADVERMDVEQEVADLPHLGEAPPIGEDEEEAPAPRRRAPSRSRASRR